MTTRQVYGKQAPKVGASPSIILINPKYAKNVGEVIRTASCYGISQVWFTGTRIDMDMAGRTRIPREERMKGYGDVELINFDYPFDCFPQGVVPVAVELIPSSENLVYFEHPENAVYVFGPEDGSISSVMKRHCHKFVQIPTRHCLNLSMAVGTILFDRASKLHLNNGLALPTLQEDRGFIDSILGA